MGTFLSDFVLREHSHINSFFDDFIISGGQELLGSSIEVRPFLFLEGFSGYEYYQEQKKVAAIYFGVSQIGTFVIKKEILTLDGVKKRIDNYAADGRFLFSEENSSAYILYVDYFSYDQERPIINHLYNTLSYQYRETGKGEALTQIMGLIEKTLRKLYSRKDITLNVKLKANDPLILGLIKRYNEVEFDSVLTWKEKRISFDKIKEDAKRVIYTLSRVHRLSYFRYKLPIQFKKLLMWLKFLIKNPIKNLRGYSYRYTVGILLWFLGVVKNNIGYSIALAVYAPFTYYFITQPMNPHAMWAVGKVRNAYLSFFDDGEEEAPIEELVDQTNSKMAALKKNQDFNLLTTGDWGDRMSAFKAMQIGLEKNMLVAERMGRVEQLENNFNFPLIAEQAFFEVERYESQVKATLKFNKGVKKGFKKYLEQEQKLIDRSKQYIWAKLYQFFIDHPYILMDTKKEHKEKSYYLGRSFVAFEKMTEKLIKSNLSITNHPQASKIKQLANDYLNMKQEMGSVVANVSANTKYYDPDLAIKSEKLRKHMKRQWEIIYLQQNKRQEAATFGLQAYIWSVRQALWVLQSFYSNKKEELATLAFKFSTTTKAPEKVVLHESINETYESLFHILTYEFASIKREFKENLPGDQEASTREELIKMMKDNLVYRDKLLRTGKEIARKPMSL